MRNMLKGKLASNFFAAILLGALLAAAGCGSGNTGLGSTTPPPTGTNSNSFDWGAPFFYGRNVYTSIDGSSAANAPYWAYTQSSIAAAAGNVVAVTVDGGPFIASQNSVYVNGVFATVTVCVPGTSNCQNIDHVLVDTGSYGLRLLAVAGGGEFALTLPQQVGNDSNPINECTQFVDGFIWGPVLTADIKISGESASSVPIQVVGNSTFTAPAGCTAGGGTDESNAAGLGANGILGIGPFPQDCGSACTSANGSTPIEGTYYDCSTSGCVAAFESLAAQVQNPVTLFAADNNGTILELPGVSGAAASVNGVLVFGIDTKSNNALGTTPILGINTTGSFPGDFTTNYNGNSLTGSFIDSGSNALFFDNSSISVCADNTSFYCPSGIQLSQSATQVGANGTTSVVNFNVNNADALINGNPNATAFNGFAGPN